MIFILIYSGLAFIENVVIELKLNKFKESANVVVYELDDEYDFQFKQNDILLSRQSGHKNLLIRDIISFYVGGHAGLVIDPAGTKTIEVLGYEGYEDIVKVYENDWITSSIEVIGLRSFDAKLNYTQFLGQDYDWYPYLPNNDKYCTELITATYKEAGYNLDYDYGIATVNDIILSGNTRIFLYKEIRDNLVYIYWED